MNNPKTRVQPKATKSERLALRVTVEDHELLHEASRASDTTVSEFVLRAATRAAEDVLADRRRFVLPDQQWIAFVEALDRPARVLPGLRALLESPSVLPDE